MEVRDGYDIYLFAACARCLDRKLKYFRRDIFESYRVEEPIEED